MYQKIRLANYVDEHFSLDRERKSLNLTRKEMGSDLEKKVTMLFAKRLSVDVSSNAFLGY
jgi:hypothetical protein